MSLTIKTSKIKLQIAEPPVETPRSDGDSSKTVIIGILHRGEQRFPAEGCLNLGKTNMVWEIDKTEGLVHKEIELLQGWTKYYRKKLWEG